MKTLLDAAKENPELARELKELRARQFGEVRALAARHSVELSPDSLADDDLDSVGGGNLYPLF